MSATKAAPAGADLNLSLPLASADTGPFSLAPQAEAAAAAPTASTTPAVAEVAEVAAPAVQAVEVASAPVAPQAEPASTPVQAKPRAPKAERFELPLDNLHALLQGAGLEWVHSDTEKVQAVAQAIALEPAPVRVPRERKPVVLADEGPLVLVETRKDLAQTPMPFDPA